MLRPRLTFASILVTGPSIALSADRATERSPASEREVNDVDVDEYVQHVHVKVYVHVYSVHVHESLLHACTSHVHMHVYI